MRIKLENICKSFGETEVLHNISFDEDVNALAIIGPSGSGKSTLLRIIGGLLAPTSGTLTINKTPVDMSEAGLLEHRRHIGFVFQDGGLFHHMTAQENISIPLSVVHRMPKENADAHALNLLKRLGLEREMDKHPAELSGGQKQRVAIARAIASKPSLLLFDEPTSALDPEYTNEVLNVINDLREGGAHLIIVTHEMGFARNACDHVAFIHDGSLIEYGASEDIFKNPKSFELQRFLSKLLEWSL